MAKRKKKKYAGFGIRFIAWLIDVVIFTAAWAFLRHLPLLPFGRFFFRNFSFLASALYSILLWVNWNGQTIGKKAMKIKVVREDRKALDYKTAIVRYVGYFISAPLFCLGFFWIIWDDKKQGWHDKIAGTYVVGE